MRISLIEPADTHYYQPGWTLVGGGAYAQGDTARPMAGLVPPGVEWLRTRVERVDPEARRLLLEGGDSLEYRNLIVRPGLRLAWERIEGLEETLGRNGVTSNYRYDLAPYTWELVRRPARRQGAVHPAGDADQVRWAPQKAMYLSCDHWLREGVLQDIEVEFDPAGAALFGVADFVPPLMEYVRKYSAELAFNSNLVKVDGAARKAWFEVKDADGNTNLAERTSTCCTWCRRSCRRPSSPPAAWATRPAGAKSTRRPCNMSAMARSSPSAMSAAPPTRRPRRRASRSCVAENLSACAAAVACRCATTATAVVR